jgi:hypothetical protein
MSFGLTPAEYLAVLNEELAAFNANCLSFRHAINCAVLANHLTEIVFHAYSGNVAKLDGCTTLQGYRDHLVSLCPNLGIVRDLADFAKHGPVLHRGSVQVDRTEKKDTMIPQFGALVALGVWNHVEGEKLVVTLKDGSERFADWCVGSVVQFWNELFLAKGL